MYEYNAIMENVVDGDTVDMRIDLGFSVWVMERCRLLGIDTPESRTRDIREKKFGKLATQRVKELLLEGSKYTVKTQFDSKGKFGRTMVDVHLPDGETICNLLVSEHLAVPYHGENKKEIRKLHEKNWDLLDLQAKRSAKIAKSKKSS